MVAANTSIRLALATVTRVNENIAVNNMVTASLATGFLTKYKTKIDVVGSREERKVLTAFASRTTSSSS